VRFYFLTFQILFLDNKNLEYLILLSRSCCW